MGFEAPGPLHDSTDGRVFAHAISLSTEIVWRVSVDSMSASLAGVSKTANSASAPSMRGCGFCAPPPAPRCCICGIAKGVRPFHARVRTCSLQPSHSASHALNTDSDAIDNEHCRLCVRQILNFPRCWGKAALLVDQPPPWGTLHHGIPWRHLDQVPIYGTVHSVWTHHPDDHHSISLSFEQELE